VPQRQLINTRKDTTTMLQKIREAIARALHGVANKVAPTLRPIWRPNE